MNVCVCVHARACVRACVRACMRTCVRVYACACICACVYTCVCVHVHVCNTVSLLHMHVNISGALTILNEEQKVIYIKAQIFKFA